MNSSGCKGLEKLLINLHSFRFSESTCRTVDNTMTLDQVTVIVNGRRVLGPQQDIVEVQNAQQAYEVLLKKDPYSIQSMLEAHKLLMIDLTKEVGMFRSGGVWMAAN